MTRTEKKIMRLYKNSGVTVKMISQITELAPEFIKHVIRQNVSYEPFRDEVMNQQIGVVLGSKRESYYTTEQEMLTKPTYTYEQVQHEA